MRRGLALSRRHVVAVDRSPSNRLLLPKKPVGAPDCLRGSCGSSDHLRIAVIAAASRSTSTSRRRRTSTASSSRGRTGRWRRSRGNLHAPRAAVDQTCRGSPPPRRSSASQCLPSSGRRCFPTDRGRSRAARAAESGEPPSARSRRGTRRRAAACSRGLPRRNSPISGAVSGTVLMEAAGIEPA